MDMMNNKTGNIFGRRWSPTKNDLFMCQGMLDDNRNSGENIGMDVDPVELDGCQRDRSAPGNLAPRILL
jgi:hypothetical protein